MSSWTPGSTDSRANLRRRHAASNLKRCPLCGTLNAATNAECVTCRWQGVFEVDPFQIEEGLFEVLDRCPDLGDYLPLPLQAPLPTKRRSIVRGIRVLIGRAAWRLLRPRRLDLRA